MENHFPASHPQMISTPPYKVNKQVNSELEKIVMMNVIPMKEVHVGD